MTYEHREPPITGSEVDTLLGSLERQSATLAWKCGGLDPVALNVAHPPSTIDGLVGEDPPADHPAFASAEKGDPS